MTRKIRERSILLKTFVIGAIQTAICTRVNLIAKYITEFRWNSTGATLDLKLCVLEYVNVLIYIIKFVNSLNDICGF